MGLTKALLSTLFSALFLSVKSLLLRRHHNKQAPAPLTRQQQQDIDDFILEDTDSGKPARAAVNGTKVVDKLEIKLDADARNSHPVIRSLASLIVILAILAGYLYQFQPQQWQAFSNWTSATIEAFSNTDYNANNKADNKPAVSIADQTQVETSISKAITTAPVKAVVESKPQQYHLQINTHPSGANRTPIPIDSGIGIR